MGFSNFQRLLRDFPMSELNDVYNIEVEYKEKYETVNIRYNQAVMQDEIYVDIYEAFDGDFYYIESSEERDDNL